MNRATRKRIGGGHNLFEQRCRENRLKLTPQRSAVYRELLISEDHPSADVIFRRLRSRFPNISLDTVSRTLLTFREIGLAAVVEGSGVPKRFDANMERHHHFRCLGCNRIIDIWNRSYDALDIPEEIQRQCLVFSKTVHLEGLCVGCREAGSRMRRKTESRKRLVSGLGLARGGQAHGKQETAGDA